MKKKICISVIIIQLILNIVFGGYFIIHYTYNYMPLEWFNEVSPDGKYYIEAVKVGGILLGGQNEIHIWVGKKSGENKKNNNTPYLYTYIRNEGKNLTKDNYKIEWNKEYCILTFIGESEKKYRIYWEDINED